MAIIKNNMSRGMDVVVRGAAMNGVPPTAHIGPGQTREVDCDTEAPQIAGMARVGAITIVEASASSGAAAPSSANEAPPSLVEKARALELSPKPSPKIHERKL